MAEYTESEEMVETDFNEWCDPEKVTLSFVWFCFSKLSEEQIGDRLMDFRNEFRDMFRKSLVKKNQEILKTSDDDTKQIVQRNIEFEVDKNENRMIDDILSQMNLTKDDWKKSLGSHRIKIKQQKLQANLLPLSRMKKIGFL